MKSDPPRTPLVLSVGPLVLLLGPDFLAQNQVEDPPLQAERDTPIVRVVRAASPAVVNLSSERVVEQAVHDFFFWGRTRRAVLPTQGSGVVIDPAGYIVTNEHVIRDGRRIAVRFDAKTDEKEYPATLIGSDRENDLALLKIDGPEPFHAVKLGRSDDLGIGETVVAIGNPFGAVIGGHANTVSAGILSAVGRDIRIEEREFTGLLQTDAAINPGNSGGPLLNVRGELIGINNAIIPFAQGIGFAIPVDRVRDILNTTLLNVDRSTRLWLGMKFSEREGLQVASVDSGGPAEEAGIRPGDTLLEVDGAAVDSHLALSKAVLPRSHGETLTLRYRRGSRENRTKLVLGSFPDRYLRERLGLSVAPDRIGNMGALRVVRVLPDSPAEKAEIRRGDHLFQVGIRMARGTYVVNPKSPEELADALQNLPPRSWINLSILRDEERYDGEIRLR